MKTSDIGHAVVRLARVRDSAAVSGEHSLVVRADLHAVSDVLRLEARLTRSHPGLVLTDRFPPTGGVNRG